MVRDRNDLLWFSDLLNTITRTQSKEEVDDRLDINLHTHVTQKRKNISTHIFRWLLKPHRTPTHPYSPLTGLLNATRFGAAEYPRDNAAVLR
jgi:dual oxidase